MEQKLTRWIAWIICLFIILITVGIISLNSGPAKIPFSKIISFFSLDKASSEYSIIFRIRLPRILLAFAIGGALSLTGVILQGLFRNPLVEPYTLGIAGGAALGVCFSIAMRFDESAGIFSLPVSGFAGAVLVVFLIYSLSIKKGALRINQLLLIGVMISFISSSLVMLIIAVSRPEDMHSIIFWMMGSLQTTDWIFVKLACFASICALVISYCFCLQLNALALGEEEALHLGVNVERTKKILFMLSAVVTGLSVSLAGIIGFVGLVVPHFLRLSLRGDYRILLLSCFLCGAVFLAICDTVARTLISPVELPVGVITGILGGSLFIFAILKRVQT